MSTNDQTTENLPTLPKSNVSVVIKENPVEQLEMSPDFLQQEVLHSSKLLNESMTLLQNQTRKMLVKEDPAIRQPSEDEIIQARLNFETIAKLMQTKVNFIKALR